MHRQDPTRVLCKNLAASLHIFNNFGTKLNVPVLYRIKLRVLKHLISHLRTKVRL